MLCQKLSLLLKPLNIQKLTSSLSLGAVYKTSPQKTGFLTPFPLLFVENFHTKNIFPKECPYFLSPPLPPKSWTS